MAAFQDTEDFKAGFADDPVFKEMAPCDYCGDAVALGTMHAVRLPDPPRVHLRRLSSKHRGDFMTATRTAPDQTAAPQAHTFTVYKGGDVEFTKNNNWELWVTCGHAVRRCDATTGHAARDVAYCDTKDRAVELVSALAHRADLLAALQGLLGIINQQQWGRPWAGRPHAQADAAEAAIAKATGSAS